MFRVIAALLCAWLPGTPFAGQQPILLQEKLFTGQVFQISSRSDLQGQIRIAKDGQEQRLRLEGASSLEYHERILQVSQTGGVDRVLRYYRQLDYRRQIGDQPQQSTLRPAARRRVVWRTPQGSLDCFSPDGPLLWSELDQVRWELFTPLLGGLLPTAPVKVGDSWKASTPILLALTDLEALDRGEVTCTWREQTTAEGRRAAVIAFSGTVAGVNADGSNRQRLDGVAHFDLDDAYIFYLSLTATSWMLDGKQKEVGTIEGRFTLTRRRSSAPELADGAFRASDCEPTAANTWILFQDPGVGAEFQYPRSWTLRKADARQIILDAADGSGMLITLEPLAQVPTAVQFQQEAATSLGRQSFKISRSHPPRRLAPEPRPLDQFSFEVEATNRSTWVFDYYVTRQAAGGATVAARYPAAQAASQQRYTEQIMRSLQLTGKK
jgi:hypothetical protein